MTQKLRAFKLENGKDCTIENMKDKLIRLKSLMYEIKLKN